MDVRDILKSNPVVCGTLDGISECALYMYRRNVGFLAVLDENDVCVGVVTDRDVVCAGVAQGIDLDATPVTMIMERNFKAVGPDVELKEVLKIMQVEGVRRLPVLEAGKCVGVVSLDDLIMAGFCTLENVAMILSNQHGEPNPDHNLRPMLREPSTLAEIEAQNSSESSRPSATLVADPRNEPNAA